MSVATLAGGRYRVERILGSGGMAVVYAAHDEELNRPVAVKLLAEHLAEDEEFRDRFVREARIAARLAHPHVVAVYDAGEDDGRPYIVMELVHGETFASVLARAGRLPVHEVVEIGTQAAAGLDHAHRHGLVHRDVKPQNLLIRDDGVVKLADFGIAHAATATRKLTQVGTILGTAAYLSPEQAAGSEVTPAADVYSLGAVLYEALTGRPPFPADTLVQFLIAQQHGRVTPPGDLVEGVPPHVEAAVMRSLARNPAYRPASAGELARLLAGPREATTVAAPDRAPTVALPDRAPTVAVPPHPPTMAMPRRAPYAPYPARPLFVAAAVLAALVLLVIVLAAGGGDSRPATLPPDRPNQPAQQARDLAEWLRAVAD